MSELTIKPERPGGFLDFLPKDFLAREKILRTIAGVFRSFGFDPVETPRIEFLRTLAGEESDTGKNIFHIKSAGDDEPLALPFDHTVPFARLLAANPYDPKRKTGLRLPFRRMALGPVFRADTPQSGRFRQFYQFDADIAGTTSMLADAEIIAMMHTTIVALGIERFHIRINNRKILNGLAELAGIQDRGAVKAADLTRSMMRILDKLDKTGVDAVSAELAAAPQNAVDPAPHLAPEAIDRVRRFLSITGNHAERLDQCQALFGGIAAAGEGVAELRQILTYLKALNIPSDRLEIDFSIARGLDYYTGPVMELILADVPEFGSVFSGGRYNGLVSRFTGKELPATGASIGVDRLFAALDHMGALDKGMTTVTQVMVLRLTKDQDPVYLSLVTHLRSLGLNAEISLVEDTTFKGQFNFAISRGVKFVVICGLDEIARKVVQVKNLETREQREMALDALADYFGVNFTAAGGVWEGC